MIGSTMYVAIEKISAGGFFIEKVQIKNRFLTLVNLAPEF